MSEADFSARAMAMQRQLYRAAFAILGRDADCEDAVQDALMRAWSRLGSLREPKYFETWLMRILINVCRTMRKKRPLTAELPASLAAAASPDPQLWSALAALPDAVRLCMVLHYNDGFSVEEVAKMTGSPQGTVKWRLHKGRAALRLALGEEAFR